MYTHLPDAWIVCAQLINTRCAHATTPEHEAIHQMHEDIHTLIHAQVIDASLFGFDHTKAREPRAPPAAGTPEAYEQEVKSRNRQYFDKLLAGQKVRSASTYIHMDTRPAKIMCT
jgi:hypothetical protein